ncbi:hypothetical protein EJB05_13621, partial [Eragrostis curvula]
MAPPTTPASSASASGKKKDKEKASGSSSGGGAGAGGKKKVTPVQVAFLVERYLADNGFTAALAAFRSDAAHLFKPHHHKPAPKGLLPLADILHDYIALKESRVAVDSAMGAMHSLVSTYYASHPAPPPVPPMMLPLPAGAQPASPPLVPSLFVAPPTASASSPPALPHPQGTVGYAQTSTSVVVHNSSDMSTPAPTSLPTKKRKATKSAGKTSSASKKSCIAPATTSHAKGKAVPQLPIDNLEQIMSGSAAQPSSVEHSLMPNLPVQCSTVAKSLFGPPQPQVHSSPSTPPQSNLMGDQPTAYQTERPSSVVANAHTQAQQDPSSVQCSMVSSKTLIVSPLKGSAYYAVERSYHVSSPLKSTIHKSSKREHVKGKLNFDTTDARPGSSEQICDQVASTSSDGDKQDDFEIDFTNLDIFNGEFSFSELLVDFDLDTEGVQCQNSSTSTDVQRLEPVAESSCMTVDPVLPDSVKTMAVDPIEDTSLQGAPSVTSVRSITKRIKIVSPVKGRTAY